MPTLTVFTPTYNRASTLPRVFQSLQQQSSRDFIWLVVDDGSTDNTRELVAGWTAHADFPIEYEYQVNRGKHNAHNAAVALARTELFLIIDSDDELLPNAVETVTSTWKKMTRAEKETIAGIWTQCREDTTRPAGGRFPGEQIDASIQELHYRHNDNREMLPAFVTAILRKYPFPETPPGECPYIPEAYVWARITRSHPIRFLNVACRIYNPGEGLLSDARHQYRYSKPVAYGYFTPLENEFEWFWHRPLFFVLSAVQGARFSIFSGDFSTLVKSLPWKAKALVFAAVPVAVALLVRDKLTRRIARELGTGA